MLEVAALEVRYGEACAVERADLEVRPGELVTIVGANGAGKTSLIRAIAGMLRPTAGTIRFRGRDITGWPSHRVCELGIGQVAEGRQVFPTLTVEENLRVGGMLRRARGRLRANLARTMEWFPRLRERRRQPAGTLSGGEQQMLAIARCLMAEPELIMLDEPSLGLAPAIVEEVFAIVERLRAEGRTVLLVEQNVAASLRLADRAYVLENGRIVGAGTGPELLGDDRIRRAYLGL